MEVRVFKVVVLGNVGAGKTSIINKYVTHKFDSDYCTTIGVEFLLKAIEWDEKTEVRLHIWDIPGGARAVDLTQLFYRGARGAIIVFDLMGDASLRSVVKWKKLLDTRVSLPDDKSIPTVLLANKCDLQKGGKVYNAKEMDECCINVGIDTWFETSAKCDINIRAAFSYLITKMFLVEKLYPQITTEEAIKLSSDKYRRNKGKGCKCPN